MSVLHGTLIFTHHLCRCNIGNQSYETYIKSSNSNVITSL